MSVGKWMQNDFIFDWSEKFTTLLKEIYGYDSDDSLDEVYYDIHKLIQKEFELLKNEIDEWINANSGMFFIERASSVDFNRYGFWYVELENIDKFLSQIDDDATNVRIEYNKKDNVLMIKTYYRCSYKVYELIPVRSLKKKELQDIIRSQCKKETNDFTRHHFGKPLSRLSKEEILLIIPYAVETFM